MMGVGEYPVTRTVFVDMAMMLKMERMKNQSGIDEEKKKKNWMIWVWGQRDIWGCDAQEGRSVEISTSERLSSTAWFTARSGEVR